MKNILLLIFRSVIILSSCLILTTVINAQEYKLPDFSPIAPKEQEFVKYMSCPVSEYTGIPDIQVPIFNISVDEINVPIALSYYAKGIKVNQEASWVGLGWDLNIGGSVIQKVQDLDDLDNTVERIIPDYNQNADHSIRVFPKKIDDYLYGSSCIENQPGYSSSGVVQEDLSYLVFTDFYIPVDGEYTCTQYSEIFNRDQYGNFETNTVDSEPDIFIANFLGHKVEFILDYDNFTQNYDIIILNTKRYKVNETTNGWIIVSPDGTKFTFSQCDTTIFEHAQTGTSPQSRIQTRNWNLTKIETYRGKEISFKYQRSNKIYNTDNISESYGKAEITATEQTFLIDMWDRIKQMAGPDIGYGSSQDQLTSTYQYVSYIDSIIFPSGNIVFSLTNRDDLINSKKIDSISIYNQVKKISSFSFNYFYTISIQNSNCYSTYTYPNASNMDVLYKRLVLDSVTENGKPPYNFYYNSQQLPPKTSYATDYWGYYNGQNNNLTFNANPTRFNFDNVVTPSSNWSNHSAFEKYCKAGVLNKIVYPTGGYEEFYYELNSFDTEYLYHQIPDSNGVLDTFSFGNGLRIKKNRKYSIDNNCVKTTHFTYQEGIYLDRKELVSNTNFNDMSIHPSGSGGAKFFRRYSYSGYLTCSNNFFTTPLFDLSGIGYSKVTIEKLSDNQENGKIIKYFHNKKNSSTRSEINLPSISPDIINGSLKKMIIYDSAMSKVKEIVNHYHSEKSNVFHGVRFTSDGLYVDGWIDDEGSYLITKLQFLAGLYPILSRETILDSTLTTFYFGNDSLTTIESYTYDSKRQVSKILSTDSKGVEYEKQFTYPYWQLGSQNRINKPNKIVENAGLTTIAKTATYYFTDNDGLIVLRSINYAQGDNTGRKVIFDDYDLKGNLTQYHLGDYENPYFNYNINFITYLWGYNYSLPIAKIENATFVDVITQLGITYEQLQSKNSNELITLFNTLRQNMPNAMISSFTYDPLIGVTTITDPNGILTNYDYDDNNRLETVSDMNENILKHIDYNFFNPAGK